MPKIDDYMEPLFTAEQIAERYGLSLSRLAMMRHTGKGPRYVKLGAGLKTPVRYPLSALKEFERSRRSTAGNGGKAPGRKAKAEPAAATQRRAKKTAEEREAERKASADALWERITGSAKAGAAA
jgi:hypothetical protein